MLFGDTPRFGFAPALSVTAWLVLTVYAVEQELYPQLQLIWALAVVGAVSVLLALVFPGTPLHPAASPCCRCTGRWASRPTACSPPRAARLAAAAQRTGHPQRRRPPSGLPLLTLERLTFRFVGAGFVLLSATLLAGTLFSEYFYGRAWRWEHKTVFSVLAWDRLRAAAAGAGPLRLARPHRHAGALYRLHPAAAGVRRFALRAGSRPGPHRMKYLLIATLLLVAWFVWRARARARAPPRRRRAAGRTPALPQEMVRCPSARCTCRATTRCRAPAAGCTAATSTAPRAATDGGWADTGPARVAHRPTTIPPSSASGSASPPPGSASASRCCCCCWA
jgi:hypothetical protein